MPLGAVIVGSLALTEMARRLEGLSVGEDGWAFKNFPVAVEGNMLKCLRRILQMWGSDGLYVTAKGKQLMES